MSTTRLHYFYDPLCGWCYGVAPLVQAARQMLPVVEHAGGLFAGEKRRNMSPDFRALVLEHDQRIAELSGQLFGEPYKNILLNDGSARLDSEPPTTAILAADQVAGRGLDMLSAIQTAHYVEGRHVAEREVLKEIAAGIGLERTAFDDAYEAVAGGTTQAHINESRGLLNRLERGGFPTFALEADGEMQILDFSPYLGKAEEWRMALRGHAALASELESRGVADCNPDGCSI